MQNKIAGIAAVLCAGSVALAGCASDATDATDTTNATDGTDTAATNSAATAATQASSSSTDNAGGSAASSSEASALELEDGYCRAKEPDSDMTACFGTLANSSGTEITVESFTAPDLGGASTELHEVVDGQMREKEGGFTIAANGSHELAPGGEHLMVLGYPDPIQAGDVLTFTLVMSDGSEAAVDFPVREQPSGEEDYGGGDHGGDHGSHH